MKLKAASALTSIGQWTYRCGYVRLTVRLKIYIMGIVLTRLMGWIMDGIRMLEYLIVCRRNSAECRRNKLAAMPW
jgi:hypothetical protein